MEGAVPSQAEILKEYPDYQPTEREIDMATWVLFESISNALEIFAYSLKPHLYAPDLRRAYELIVYRAVNAAHVKRGLGPCEAVGTPGPPGVQGSVEKQEEG